MNTSLPTSQSNESCAWQNCLWAEREEKTLASYAMHSRDSAGRRYAEPLHRYRSPYQRDRDRVLHSAAFRRLSGKMQVFTGDMGDYHRTRLTHTHEVATIARTIARVLHLNEDLVEALALLHDIGHPPFGHSGEEALDECLSAHGGFSHNAFAMVLAEELETRYTPYPGLNLTREVLAGQDYRITHGEEGGALPPLLEVQLVDLCDSITYTAHDVDDALTLGLLRIEQLSGLELVRRALHWNSGPVGGDATARRKALVHSLIDVQVADVIDRSQSILEPLRGLDGLAVRQLGTTLDLSPPLASEKEQLSHFLFENVYRHPQLITIRERAKQRVRDLFDALVAQPQRLPPRFIDRAHSVGVPSSAAHYIAGMTDRFCDTVYNTIVESGHWQAPDWQ
ncbi:MAG: deoxyguanosinetriphosphate triphosphohydrolase-like protein [Pirellulaceae bacterium]|nr:MAG: deoxyguanosinetriphosphate triphosphohydrolase-like protein [Pirellulaceae bacterium]